MDKLLRSKNTVDKKASFKKKPNKRKINRRFRLIHFKSKFYTPKTSLINSKCTFKVYRAGLIISGDFYDDCKRISVLSEEINTIELIRGKETIDTFYLSPIHLLSKIGLPNSVSRHFRFHPTEYKIAQTKIRINGKEQELELIASGYRFERLRRLLKKLGYGDKLKIKRKPSVDLSEFRDYIRTSDRNNF